MQSMRPTTQEHEDCKIFASAMRDAAGKTSEMDAAAVAQAIIGALFAGMRIGSSEQRKKD